MKHRIFTILAAISLLLFVAVVALWADTGYLLGARGSRATRLRTGPDSAEIHYVVGVDSRALVFEQDKFLIIPPTGGSFHPSTAILTPSLIDWYSRCGPASSWHWGGFEWASAELTSTDVSSHLWMFGWQSYLRLPYWALLILFAVMPTWHSLSYMSRRRREKRRGLCPIYDYDLRASKERCPECGTPIATANAAERPLVD